MSETDLSSPGLARKLRLAVAAMAWERLWPALWPITGTLALFLVVAIFEVFSWLPGWLHLLVLLGFGLALVYGARTAARDFRWPRAEAARRRLERASGLGHRPLETLIDDVSEMPEAQTRALWRIHRQRARALIRRLRIGVPRAGLVSRDPKGFRVALALLLVVGFVSAGPGWQTRLAGAFTPDFSASGGRGIKLAAWIAPPAYTGVAPIFLTSPAGDAGDGLAVTADGRQLVGDLLRIPTGSTFYAQVHGGKSQPALRLDNQSIAFAVVDSENFQIDRVLEAGEELAVVQGRAELGRWQIVVVPDLPPSIAFTLPIAVDEHGAMRLEYEAADDYGLVQSWVRIGRTGAVVDVETFDLPLAGVDPTAVEGFREYDLTPHPWAGLPVAIALVTTDALGQIGESDEIEMLLPQRDFQNPVARAVIEQRRELAADPQNRDRVAFALDAITDARAEEIPDFGTYLSLRSSISRLKFDQTDQAITEVIDQLWDTALALEDGELGLAERELRLAQQALQDALSRGATDEEIERLMDQLQEALNEYLEALAEQALEQAEGERGEPGQRGRPIDREALNQMLQEARELSRLGAREAAQQLLAELQEILENLQAGTAPRQGEGVAAEAMRELGEVMQGQQQLMDRTFQQTQRGAFGNPEEVPRPEEQQALQEELEELMRGLQGLLGQIPGALDEAAEAMRGAGQALGQSDLGRALSQQTEALQQLRQGAAQLLEQFMGEGEQPGGENAQRLPVPEVDPLGRPLNGLGAYTGDRVQVPDEADLQQARDILEELFRRAGERTRPLLELDYIDRLLRRF